MLFADVCEQQPLKLIYKGDPRAASSNWPDDSEAKNLENMQWPRMCADLYGARKMASSIWPTMMLTRSLRV